MPFYQYRNPIVKIKRSYDRLHNGVSYTGKMASLYWIRALVSQIETRICAYPLGLLVPLDCYWKWTTWSTHHVSPLRTGSIRLTKLKQCKKTVHIFHAVYCTVAYWLTSTVWWFWFDYGYIANSSTMINHQVLKDFKEIETPRHWPWCGEFTGDRWMASNAEEKQVRRYLTRLFTTPHIITPYDRTPSFTGC